MKTTFTIFTMLLTFTASAQIPDYLAGTPQWRIEWTFGGSLPCLEKHDYIYYLNGDSTVGEYNYKKVYERRLVLYDWLDSPPPPPPYEFCEGADYSDKFRILIRQEGRKMFVRDQMGQDTLLYDFNLEVGDTLPITYNMYPDEDFVVTAIDSMLIGSSFRKIFHINIFTGDVLIEGIGFSSGLIDLFYNYEFPSILNCFVRNDTTWYPQYGEPCDLSVSIDNNSVSEQISAWPNPVKDQLNIVLNTSSQIQSIHSIGIDGRRKDLDFDQTGPNQLMVDFSEMAKGLYLLKLHASDRLPIKIKVIKR